MAGVIRIKRGLETNRGAVTPVEGEPVYSTDTKRLYIGDGATAGGVDVVKNTFPGINDTSTNTKLTIESDGTLNVASTTNYENLVTHDDDVPNKKYVDDAIADNVAMSIALG